MLPEIAVRRDELQQPATPSLFQFRLQSKWAEADGPRLSAVRAVAQADGVSLRFSDALRGMTGDRRLTSERHYRLLKLCCPKFASSPAIEEERQHKML